MAPSPRPSPRKRGEGERRQTPHLRTFSEKIYLSGMSELYIAEIPFEDGGIRFRYARKISSDGTCWIRDGFFQAFHPNGALASEGSYVEGVEDGPWRDFHDNGQLAAEGNYSKGVEAGAWRFWNPDGAESASE